MGTKRLIFAIIVVILLIGGLVGGYYYLQNDSRQAAILQEEMKKVLDKDLLDEEISMDIKAMGNYGKVEKAVKEYLNDVRSTFYSMQNFCSIEEADQILSTANLEADSVNLTVVEQKVEEKKNELNSLISKTTNLKNDDFIMKYTEGKDIRERYIDVYKNIVEDQSVQTKISAAQEKIKDEQEEAEERLDRLDKAITFLKKNSRYWEINDGKIQFTNTNKLAEYLEVLNGSK